MKLREIHFPQLQTDLKPHTVCICLRDFGAHDPILPAQ
jgi:hypothetical protein